MRFALIENEHRTRQAVRGIRGFLRRARRLGRAMGERDGPSASALIGFGTIGTGVVQRAARERAARSPSGSASRSGWSRIADLDASRAAGVDLAGIRFDARRERRWSTTRRSTIVVELIGGYEPARRFVLAAIGAGKHVVTANKALLAVHGEEIVEAAAAPGVDVGFEASVGGGIPILRSLHEGLAANRIESVLRHRERHVQLHPLRR